MSLFCIIALSATGLVAGLSVLALPFWLMGVPGTQNSYAKGWKLGLYAVGSYPVVWFCLFAFWRSAKKQATVDRLSSLNLWTGTGALISLALAAVVVALAFKIMSRP
jgi:hypothetical protein